ncbi:hypothetical protein LTS00_018374, partial [Friedmanniomyces endolithicus]
KNASSSGRKLTSSDSSSASMEYAWIPRKSPLSWNGLRPRTSRTYRHSWDSRTTIASSFKTIRKSLHHSRTLPRRTLSSNGEQT